METHGLAAKMIAKMPKIAGNCESSAKKTEPYIEHNCPPLGWLRVDGRLRMADEGLNAKISIELPESLTADEMANEIIARLLPPYSDFLDIAEKYGSELPEA